MADEGDSAEGSSTREELIPRQPTQDDLVLLCRRLNDLGAKYVVVGGFAIIQAGFARPTAAIDLLVATDLENEAKVYRALEVFPDKALRELKSASAIDYLEASRDVIIRKVARRAYSFRLPSAFMAHESAHPSGERRGRSGFPARIFHAPRRNAAARLKPPA